LQEYIFVKGARSHNLKNIDVKLPKNKLVVITGVSGSGKSSLAFDTIYAEGQRRYVESLSSYARQFLGVMDKPDVDYIEGLSPAISIDQKTSGHNPRSTVGTVTEIYDYLRLLFARVGHPHSPTTGKRLQSQTVQEIVDTVLAYPRKYQEQLKGLPAKVLILSPVVKNRKGTYEELFSRFLAQGYTRARVDGEIFSLEEEIKLDKFKKHNIELVVDRLVLPAVDLQVEVSDLAVETQKEFLKRLTDSIETSINLGDGEVLINLPDLSVENFYSEDLVDPETGESFPKVEPNSFSFNSPYGACPKCNGLGTIKDIDPVLLYNPSLSVSEGGIFPWAKMADNPDSWSMQLLKAVARNEGFDLREPIGKMKSEDLQMVLYGTGEKSYEFQYVRQMDGRDSKYERPFEGVIPTLLRRYEETDSDYIREDIEQYMRERLCDTCAGKRLKPTSLAVTILCRNIFEVGNLPIDDFLSWVQQSLLIPVTIAGVVDPQVLEADALTSQEYNIANRILKEINTRANFLVAVGLNYLTLNRTAKTLSGGESQRIRLASQIGTGLTGVLYVLDEPSVGLHQSDNERLLRSLQELRDLGNTVLVVEHDEDTVKQADYIVDIGPAAGEHGGELVASGTLPEFLKHPTSLTAKYLRGEIKISRADIVAEAKLIVPKFELVRKAQTKASKYLKVIGASQNNLKNLDVSFPLGQFVVVTGVSGSGKSSLVNEILYPSLAKFLYKSKIEIGKHLAVEGMEQIDKVVNIDQSPIGRTPRSNPATYTGVFTAIRELFASSREAKTRGYTVGRFSFNTKGGRCENCKGDGLLRIEMQFLPDVYVKCETCNGRRYNRETLQIDFKGKNIAQVLEMTVEESVEFFANIPAICSKMQTLLAVGLGYIRLGQQATTLSGGEAQRVKLATELSKRSTGKTVFILDEPTTGLHFDDVRKLLVMLHSLVLKGNSVIVIEHNLDLIKTADWLIDLGPAGGVKGGELIAIGTPEEVSQNPASLTGQWLKKVLNS